MSKGLKKNFEDSSEVYRYIKSGTDDDNPLGLGVGGRRNTSKKVVDFCVEAGIQIGLKQAKAGPKKESAKSSKKPAGKTRPCACGCGAEIPLSRKRATLPGHQRSAAA